MEKGGNRSHSVTLDRVTRRFGDLTAVDRCSLEIRDGEFFSLLGPSGCGKTTLLRIIAGFEEPDEGEVSIGATSMTGVSPRKRPTAMVFQNYALFPTMTVGENVAYGLKVRKVSRADVRSRAKDALKRVDLSGIYDKPVTALSGGQQQRVALARAIVVEPKVLLFDEPLSNLDVALREQTRREIKNLQQELGITSVYVTHDQQEALAMSDRLAVLQKGRVQQVGTPKEIYFEPSTSFVATFLGGSNLFAKESEIVELTGGERKEGHILSVRPEHWAVTKQEVGSIELTTTFRQFLGALTEYHASWRDHSVRLLLSPDVDVGARFYARPTRVHWVPQADD